MEPKIRTIHGETVTDKYFDLRDRENPETIAFLEAENRRTAEAMKPLEPLQKELYDEMLGRIQETDSTVPAPFGAFEYYSRTEQGKQYQILCRRYPEQVILDCNELAAGHDYFSLAFSQVSPDGNLLAYAIDTDGSEVYTLRFKDLRTGQLLSDEIKGVYYSADWAADSLTFFYTTLDAIKRPYRLWRCRLGEMPILVFEEPDERFNVSIQRSRSGEYLFLGVDSHITTEFRWCPADDPEGAFTLLKHRQQGVEYYVEHQGDSFYVRTNEAAKNFKLMRVRESVWEEVIPHRMDVMLEDMAGFRDHLVIIERDRGLKRLRIDDYFVSFDEPAYNIWFERNDVYDTSKLRFAYTSLVTPVSVYDYDMKTHERVLLKRTPVLGGYDPDQYVSERIFAGNVPISLVYRKGMERKGTFLYGYGSYGITTDPAFSSDRISLLDRGIAYALAHIRGSGDMGRFWYDDGKLMHKKHTFEDFIACAELMTQPLAISGRSAGGLLMGAVTNMRPDLFRAVIAGVPFVDVINTMLDPTLPLTVTEYEEWGNPNEPPAYEYMKSYAPYENVTAQDYPNILVTAGLNDPRVPYWEPAKWVAKLLEFNTSGSEILLKTEMGAGHGGPSGRYAKLKERALEFTFVLRHLIPVVDLLKDRVP
jgi:oligopeptidase B